MNPISREFQIFVKPTGPLCNLDCKYCYYLKKKNIFASSEFFRMSENVLEKYIIQHIQASTEPVINFSWHGGEPTILGVDYFRKIVDLQKKYCPIDRKISNGIQTNGTLLSDEWCQFFAKENFYVGVSMDGPQECHDQFRLTKKKQSSFQQTICGYNLLQQYQIKNEILCVVNSYNVNYPFKVYHFFKQLGTQYITFLPLVERDKQSDTLVTSRSVPSEAFGDFLCTIFDEWKSRDIGRIKIQIFEEAIRPAFGQEHTLCIFRTVCGGVPVIEHNGDFYSCDFFVEKKHYLGNILDTPLIYLLDSPEQRAFGQKKQSTLPDYCVSCNVLDMCNGGCPKDRFCKTPQGEPGLNYLCAGYKKFFNSCLPFVDQVAKLWRSQHAPQKQKNQIDSTTKTGRNDPCPCGSGKKYKNCCQKI